MTKWMKKQYEQLLGSCLLSMGSLLIISRALDLKSSLVSIMVGVIILQGLMLLIELYRKQPITYVGIGLVMMGVWGIVSYDHLSIGEHLINTYQWFWNRQAFNGADEKLYNMICMGALLGTVNLASYIGQKAKIVKIFFVGVSLIGLIYMAIIERDASKLGISCVMAYNLMVLTEYMHIKQYKKEQQEAWKVTASLLPLCFLIGISSMLLPTKKEPLSWKWIGRSYEKVIDMWRDLEAEVSFRLGTASDEFGLNFMGAEADSLLGAKLGEGNAIMLSAEPRTKTHHPIYLAGSYKNTYTGSSWQSIESQEEGQDTESSQIEDYKLNTFELLYGLTQRENVDENEKLIQGNKMKISYEQIRTKTLFIPSYTEKIDGTSNIRTLSYKASGITFKKRQKQNQYYELNFLELNTEGEWFKQHLRKMDDFSYEKSEVLNQENFKKQFKGTVDEVFLKEVSQKQLLEKLKKRSKRIEETYTILPEDLPQRIQELTLAITKDCETSYDKLKNIEAYLKQYKYTKTPQKVPKDRDFVDYFLFESKEGYCTYFASSMAVMARSIGIPTRYVEGFIGAYEKNTKVIQMCQESAHAWVEAYFEGMGWVRFEPTPGYETITYTTWAPYQSKSEGVTKVPPIQEQMMEELINPVQNLEEVEQEMSKVVKIVPKRSGVIIKGLIGILLLVSGTIMIQVILYNYKLKKADDLSWYRMAFKEIVYLLGKMGINLKKQETLLHFQNRVEQITNNNGLNIATIIESYSKIRYGKGKVSKVQKEEMKQFYSTLTQYQRKKYGYIKGRWWQLAYRISDYRKG